MGDLLHVVKKWARILLLLALFLTGFGAGWFARLANAGVVYPKPF